MMLDYEEYQDLADGYAGYCRVCDEVTEDSGTEPDAEGYRCPVCGRSTLMGLEQAVLMGLVEIGGEE